MAASGNNTCRRFDRLARDGVELAQRLAPGARCADDGIYPAKLDHELRQILGRLVVIVNELIGVRLAVDPSINRPREGVRARRVSLAQRLGDVQ